MASRSPINGCLPNNPCTSARGAENRGERQREAAAEQSSMGEVVCRVQRVRTKEACMCPAARRHPPNGGTGKTIQRSARHLIYGTACLFLPTPSIGFHQIHTVHYCNTGSAGREGTWCRCGSCYTACSTLIYMCCMILDPASSQTPG